MKIACLCLVAVLGCAIPNVARAADDVFDSNGVKIRYVTAGEGEAVVLIHGWMSDSSMWGRDSYGNTKLDADGMPGFKVIAIDCRGHGKSDKPHDQSKYGAEMAADVVRLLDHLKIKKAHLVGYSSGAFIVGKVAATQPDRVLSVIYAGQAPLIAGPTAPKSEAPGTNEVEIFAKAVEEGKGLGSYLIAVTPPDKPKLGLEQANAYTKMMFNGKDVKAFAVAGLSFPKLGVTPEDLKRCKAPTLFLHGSQESAYVKGCVATARKVLTNSQLKVIEGGDHMTTLMKPAFGSSLVEFIRANKSK